jgi:hypothetical protein
VRALGAAKYGPGVGDTEAVNLLGEVFSPDGGQLGCSLRSKEQAMSAGPDFQCLRNTI